MAHVAHPVHKASPGVLSQPCPGFSRPSDTLVMMTIFTVCWAQARHHTNTTPQKPLTRLLGWHYYGSLLREAE